MLFQQPNYGTIQQSESRESHLLKIMNIKEGEKVFFHKHLTKSLLHELYRVKMKLNGNDANESIALENISYYNREPTFWDSARTASSSVMNSLPMNGAQLGLVATTLTVMSIISSYYFTLQSQAIKADNCEKAQVQQNILSGDCKWEYNGCQQDLLDHYSCYVPIAPHILCNEEQLHDYSDNLTFAYTMSLFFILGVAYSCSSMMQSSYHGYYPSVTPDFQILKKSDDVLNAWCSHNNYPKPDDWNKKIKIGEKTPSLKEYVFSFLLSMDKETYEQGVKRTGLDCQSNVIKDLSLSKKP